jgi:hypothetical protein
MFDDKGFNEIHAFKLKTTVILRGYFFDTSFQVKLIGAYDLGMRIDVVVHRQIYIYIYIYI